MSNSYQENIQTQRRKRRNEKTKEKKRKEKKKRKTCPKTTVVCLFFFFLCVLRMFLSLCTFIFWLFLIFSKLLLRVRFNNFHFPLQRGHLKVSSLFYVLQARSNHRFTSFCAFALFVRSERVHTRRHRYNWFPFAIVLVTDTYSKEPTMKNCRQFKLSQLCKSKSLGFILKLKISILAILRWFCIMSAGSKDTFFSWKIVNVPRNIKNLIRHSLKNWNFPWKFGVRFSFCHFIKLRILSLHSEMLGKFDKMVKKKKKKKK